MTCYFPLHGYASKDLASTGGRAFTFDRLRGYADRPMVVPCGHCLGCRLDRSRNWALRCIHEASLYDSNCFITLTYSPKYLPSDASLTAEPSDFTLFMKRFRKRFVKSLSTRVRYFMCAEYGDQGSRPHYHACLFNFDFPDRTHWSTSPTGVKLYRSKILEELWPFGFATVGDVTQESAAYVARYVLKKSIGENKHMNYLTSLDLETGEATFRRAEYVTMSRRPGIGAGWFQKFSADVYPHDFIVNSKGFKLRPPRYYDNIYDELGGDLNAVKGARKAQADRRKEDNSSERLAVRYQLQVLKSKKLLRSFECQSV